MLFFLLSLQSSVKKYHVRLPKDGKDYHEEVEIDTEKEVETFHVPKTSPKEEAVDMVYDFEKVSNISEKSTLAI